MRWWRLRRMRRRMVKKLRADRKACQEGEERCGFCQAMDDLAYSVPYNTGRFHR